MERDIFVHEALLLTARPGAIVTVRTEEGREYRGRVVRTEGESALVRAFEELAFPTESHLDITLIQGIPKSEKMNLIVQKATELGVKRIIPCLSSKSAILGDPEEGQDKSHRWPAIARKAMEQCRRREVPMVSACSGFAEAIDSVFAVDGLKVILYEKERSIRLRDVASTREKRPAAIVLACGPEGGFTEEEVHLARRRGFVPISLGGRILRCETAALAALAIVQHEWGDM